MMRVGILSYFYKSCNYGGVLQAYALCRVINKLGCNAEQVKYDSSKNYQFLNIFHRPDRILYYLTHPLSIIQRIVSLVMPNRAEKKHRMKVSGQYLRVKAFEKFTNFVPQSEIVYNRKTIYDSVKNYDVMLVGSDKVWTSISKVYMLDFVPDGVKRLAYAASCAKNQLKNYERKIFRDSLPKFNAIGVRECDTVSLLQPLAGQNIVEWTLDPTLLLSKEEWDEICSSQVIRGDYLFCYFLGPDKILRDVARQYASVNNLKIVSLPHMNKYQESDDGFGDEQLYDVSPRDFLSLIKYAKFVFTDSFHGSVFSLIYHKQFCCFSRIEDSTSNTRVMSLTKLFDADSHFLLDIEQMTCQTITQLDDIDYSQPFPKFEGMKKSSLEFLERSLR